MGPFTQIARPRIGPVTLILLGHVAAISIYAATLSALPALTAARHEIRAAAAASAVADMVFSAPVLAALLQTLLAGGRYAGGRLSDLLGPGRVLSFAVVSLAAGIALLHTAGEWILIALIGLIGTTAGIGQTAALSGLMRSATGQRAVAAMSVLWNTGFDLGLLIGAFAAGSLLR